MTRMLIRYRVQLMADRTREITRLELMLEDASLTLSSVAASLASVSARAMLTALIGGESDPRVLAADHPRGGEKVAQVIIAETGADMSRFPTAEHLASWAGVAPGCTSRRPSGIRWPPRTATSG